MAEEAGDEDLDKEEAHADAHGQRYIHLGEHITETGEHNYEKASNDGAGQESRKLEGENHRDEIDREREDP